MKKIIVFVLFILFVSCNQSITNQDLTNLNGYWEIEKVVFENGDEKEYGANQNYDYFKIDKQKGIRKKVTPQLDGSFLVDDTFEKVKIRFEKEKAFLDYSTPYMNYSEEVIVLNVNELVLLNDQKKEYHYKKATAVNILGDGKKIE